MVIGFTLSLAGITLFSFAAEGSSQSTVDTSAVESIDALKTEGNPTISALVETSEDSFIVFTTQAANFTLRFKEAQTIAKAQEQVASEQKFKMLDYDPTLIKAVGTQETSGHTICCPGFACAYGDTILTGRAFGHESYGCGYCDWTNWGGGNSSFRSLGSPSALLHEAYDQIASGKPTVIHVTASWGEHWITLIGYQAVEDPANLSLDNFIALDPWDGTQLVASSQYTLYGDDCEHISSR